MPSNDGQPPERRRRRSSLSAMVPGWMSSKKMQRKSKGENSKGHKGNGDDSTSEKSNDAASTRSPPHRLSNNAKTSTAEEEAKPKGEKRTSTPLKSLKHKISNSTIRGTAVGEANSAPRKQSARASFSSQRADDPQGSRKAPALRHAERDARISMPSPYQYRPPTPTQSNFTSQAPSFAKQRILQFGNPTNPASWQPHVEYPRSERCPLGSEGMPIDMENSQVEDVSNPATPPALPFRSPMRRNSFTSLSTIASEGWDDNSQGLSSNTTSNATNNSSMMSESTHNGQNGPALNRKNTNQEYLEMARKMGAVQIGSRERQRLPQPQASMPHLRSASMDGRRPDRRLSPSSFDPGGDARYVEGKGKGKGRAVEDARSPMGTANGIERHDFAIAPAPTPELRWPQQPRRASARPAEPSDLPKIIGSFPQDDSDSDVAVEESDSDENHQEFWDAAETGEVSYLSTAFCIHGIHNGI